jgi:phosphatidylserine decarboxylase
VEGNIPSLVGMHCRLCVSKGQELGTFRLGSTVVLIFEAPPDFEFSVQPGDRVLMGQRLGARRPADAA